MPIPILGAIVAVAKAILGKAAVQQVATRAAVVAFDAFVKDGKSADESRSKDATYEAIIALREQVEELAAHSIEQRELISEIAAQGQDFTWALSEIAKELEANDSKQSERISQVTSHTDALRAQMEELIAQAVEQKELIATQSESISQVTSDVETLSRGQSGLALRINISLLVTSGAAIIAIVALLFAVL